VLIYRNWIAVWYGATLVLSCPFVNALDVDGKPCLVIFLPVAQSPLDYGCYPLELLSGEVESAAFNPNYPTILSKHLECTCVESGLPLLEVDSRFGSRSGAIADGLLQQDKLFRQRVYWAWVSP